MPYNFYEQKDYIFNFDSLFDELLKLYPLNYFTDFFSRWHLILNHFNNLPINKNTRLQFGNTRFIYDINLFGQNYHLFFNISHILSVVDLKKYYLAPLSDFGVDADLENIIYSPTKDYSLGHITTTKPIIVVPLNLGKNAHYITIEGNHRITAKKQHEISSIAIYEYTPNKRTDFLSDIDYAFYLFYNELFNLYSLFNTQSPDITTFIMNSHSNTTFRLIK